MFLCGNVSRLACNKVMKYKEWYVHVVLYEALSDERIIFLWIYFVLSQETSLCRDTRWPEGHGTANHFNLPNRSSRTRPWVHSTSNKNEYQKQKNNVSGE
jgi:hypothetical protein